jgi:two-component system sensor histidine kinase BaeS
MRSLAFKLTLAFLIVALTGSVVVALSVQLQTRREFDRYILQLVQSEFVTELIEYYQTNNSWDGVQSQFRVRPAPGENREPPRFELPPFSIVDATGQVVYGSPDRIGEQTALDTRRAVPLEVNGEVVGWIVPGFVDRRWTPGTPERAFMSNLNRWILVSAAIATVLALVIGILLARTIAQPIRKLRTATQVIAGGDLGYQVTVRAKDELGELADSFNRMSADLAHSNDLRHQMTADIAHDLRTPLSVILGYTEALSEGKLDGSSEVFGAMHEEAQHLQRLIEDLRTLSLADAGELPLMRRSVKPVTLLEQVAIAHKPHAQDKDISIEVKASQELPEIRIDPDRMAQVLGNLVSNALRYTPAQGCIRLVAEGADGNVMLKVIDNGLGIPAEDLPYIFDRFYRADRSRQLHEGESGLGLSIAKSIVEAHGGSITVESLPGEGSTFTIAIPV